LLEDNQLFIKKLRIYDSKVKAGIAEAKKEGNMVTLLEKATKALNSVLENEEEQIAVSE
jgi:hypothetical protein